jgi:hypothetical protein
MSWSPTAQDFAQALCRLETAKSVWTSVEEWHQAIDRYYLLPSGRIVRTTTTSTDNKLGITHLQDACLAAANLDLPGASDVGTVTDADADGSSHGFPPQPHVRATVHRTRPVAPTELQDRVDSTEHTCLRQVRTFTKQSASTGIVWRVEACQIWEASQLTQALVALRDGEAPRTQITLTAHGVPAAVAAVGLDRIVASVMFKVADVFRVWAPDVGCLVRTPDGPLVRVMQATPQAKAMMAGCGSLCPAVAAAAALLNEAVAGSAAGHSAAGHPVVAATATSPPLTMSTAPPPKSGRANSKAAAAAALVIARENAVAHAFGHPYNHFA